MNNITDCLLNIRICFIVPPDLIMFNKSNKIINEQDNGLRSEVQLQGALGRRGWVESLSRTNSFIIVAFNSVTSPIPCPNCLSSNLPKISTSDVKIPYTIPRYHYYYLFAICLCLIKFVTGINQRYNGNHFTNSAIIF